MAKIFAHDAVAGAEPIATGLAGVAAGTRIMTMDGEIPVEFLEAGDRIITRDAGVCTLRALTVHPACDIEMIRVAADSFGTGRPGEDVLLAPGQCVLLRDWRAKALYGQAQAMVPVSRLVDGQYVSRVTLPTARLFTLEFDARHVIYAEGLELASGVCVPAPVTA